MQEQERKWIRISFQRLPENKRSGKESSHHTKKWYDPSQPHVSPPSDISALLIFCSSSFHYLLHINARCSYYHRKMYWHFHGPYPLRATSLAVRLLGFPFHFFLSGFPCKSLALARGSITAYSSSALLVNSFSSTWNLSLCVSHPTS